MSKHSNDFIYMQDNPMYALWCVFAPILESLFYWAEMKSGGGVVP